MLRKFNLLFILLALNSSLVQASTLDGNCILHEEHERTSYYIADRSDKLEDKEGFQKSMQVLGEMIHPGERLIIGVSTGKGSDTRVLMDLVQPAQSIWVSALKIRAQQKRFTDCLNSATETLLAQEEEYEKSALLETILFVGKVMAADKAKQKRIILFSDMMQNSSAVSFYSIKPFNPQLAMSAVEKSNLIAKLPEVLVYAAGTGARVSDKQDRDLESFWTDYFKKAGAELKFYGPILVDTE